MVADADTRLKLIQLHLSWYPLMQLRDAYKLIYQGAMGSEHMLVTQQEYEHLLTAEFEHMLPDPHLRLLEPIRPDRSLFRLNLRSYKAHNHQIELLIPSLIRTSKYVIGTKTDLLEAWADFACLCERSEVGTFHITDIQHFSRWLEQEDYPAVNHSEVYRREYQPAYRLIAGRFIAELGLNDGV